VRQRSTSREHSLVRQYAVLDDVAEIDPDTELDAPLLRNSDVAFGHLLLNLDGATHRIDNAGKLDQQSVASRLNNAAAVLLDLRVGKFASQLFQRGEGALSALFG
jgi:hypothetical protein